MWTIEDLQTKTRRNNINQTITFKRSLKTVVALGNILQGPRGGGFPGAPAPSTSRILCQGARSFHCLDP